MEKKNSLLTIIMIILIALLVAAVVLLSLIIVSIAKDKNPPVTTAQGTARPGVSSKTSADKTTVPQVSFTDPFGELTVPVTVGDKTDSKPKTDAPITNDPVTDAPVTVPEVTVPVPGTEPSVTTPEVTAPGTDDPEVPHIPSGGEVVQKEDGTIVRSGSFIEDNGTALKLIIEWEAEYPADSNIVNFTVKLYLRSYTLDVGARENGVLTINGQEKKFSTAEMHLEENKLYMTLFETRSITIDKTGHSELLMDVSASWHFGGSYSGHSLPDLNVSGQVAI